MRPKREDKNVGMKKGVDGHGEVLVGHLLGSGVTLKQPPLDCQICETLTRCTNVFMMR